MNVMGLYGPAREILVLSHMHKPLLDALVDISSRVRGLNINVSLHLYS